MKSKVLTASAVWFPCNVTFNLQRSLSDWLITQQDLENQLQLNFKMLSVNVLHSRWCTVTMYDTVLQLHVSAEILATTHSFVILRVLWCHTDGLYCVFNSSIPKYMYILNYCSIPWGFLQNVALQRMHHEV